jgi:hypothetical protein
MKRYGQFDDGRNILLNWNDVEAMRTVFVRKMYGIRCSDKACIHYWVKLELHLNEMLTEMSDGSGGIWVSVDKGLILCHAVSAPTEFISWNKLILQCNLRISVDCHDKMNISDIFIVFTKLFLPHLVPQSIIIKENSSIHCIIT